MRITTAWTQENDEVPWLLSAYDENTANEWGKVPDFFSEEIEKRAGTNADIRIIVIDVPEGAIGAAFKAAEVLGSVVPTS
jgi:hypothetical protein